MSSQDRVPKIIEGIKRYSADPEAEGAINPSVLTIHDRRLCVQFLRIETNLSLTRMAILLGVNRRTIVRDVKHMNEAYSLVIDQTNVDDIRNEFFTEYRIQKERARAAKDGHLEWIITRDWIDRQAMFGILKPATQNHTDVHIGDKIINISQDKRAKEVVDTLTNEQKEKFIETAKKVGLITDNRGSGSGAS